MTRMELGQVIVIASRHALPADYQQRKIERVKSDEHKSPGDFCQLAVVHFAEHFRKPVMQRSEKGKACAAEHHIMKMPDDKRSVMNMNVDCQRSLHQTSQTADRK